MRLQEMRLVYLKLEGSLVSHDFREITLTAAKSYMMSFVSLFIKGVHASPCSLLTTTRYSGDESFRQLHCGFVTRL